MKAAKRILMAMGGMCLTSLAFADAPIVNDSWPQQAAAVQTQQPTTQQSALAQLQQPVAQQQMVQQTASDSTDLLTRIDQMQQQIRDLTGQLEMQNHRIQQLQMTQQQIYSDFNNRLDKLGSGSATTVNVTPVDTSANGTPAPTTDTQAAAQAPNTQTPSATQAQDEFKENELYQSAYRFIGVRQYTQAEAGMRMYLQQYPKGKYSANAHYWVGEIELLSGNLPTAGQEFSTVVTGFPKSDKVADAQLKLGYIYYQENKFKEARTAFNSVKSLYPNTSTAQLAQQRLDDMDRQGV